MTLKKYGVHVYGWMNAFHEAYIIMCPVSDILDHHYLCNCILYCAQASNQSSRKDKIHSTAFESDSHEQLQAQGQTCS